MDRDRERSHLNWICANPHPVLTSRVVRGAPLPCETFSDPQAARKKLSGRPHAACEVMRGAALRCGWWGFGAVCWVWVFWGVWLGLFSVAAAAPGDDSFSTVVRADKASAGSLEARVFTKDGQAIPGLFGDAVRAVEAQAGVSRPQLGSGQLIVWGAAPSETRILWDGVELPALYHFGGLRTVLAKSTVDSLALQPAGYGSAYGRGLGGILLLSSSAIPQGIHGEVSADFLDASAQLSAAFSSRLRMAVSGRIGYVDRLIPLLSSAPLADFYPLPRYWDAQGRVVIKLRSLDDGQEQLSFRVLGSGDSRTRVQASPDAASAQTETWTRTFYRIAADYLRSQSGQKIEVTPWFGIDEESWRALFGGVLSQLSRRDIRYGLRAVISQRPLRSVSFVVGADVLGDVAAISREGTLTRPPREGDIAVFGQSPGREVSSDSWSVHQGSFAVFSQITWRYSRLQLVPGLRAVAYLSDVSRLLPRIGDTPPLGFRRIDFALEPRLQVRMQAASRLALHAAAGLYHQSADAADLSAVFGNPQLGPARAVHGAVSAELQVIEPLSIEFGSFVRALFDLWARSPDLTPPLGRSLADSGSGLSYGGQLVVRLSPLRNLSGSVSYSMGRALRRSAANAPWRLADFDQPHNLQVALRYVLFGFGIGARLRYASGLPRTEVTGAYFDARDDRFDPLFGPHNAIRLPDFFQIDAQIDRSFVLSTRLRLSVLLDVQNLTNYQNAEELAYRYDYRERAYLRGMPILANLGVQLTF